MFLTNAVVATAVLLSVIVIVPAVTLLPKDTEPVKVGDAIGAFKANAVSVAIEVALSASAVFSTFANPKLALALAAFTAPVPPFTTATTPVTLVALPFTVPDKVPTNVEPVIIVPLKLPINVFAVITFPAKFPVALLSTSVFIKF